jgi:branched-chain amino acid transport system permease protein
MKEKKSFIYYLESFTTKYKVPLIVVCLALLIALPYTGVSQYVMNLVIKIGVYTMFGLGLNILVGYVGLISLGHAGFVAIGAYTCSLLMLNGGLNFWVSLLISALVAAVFGILLGLPTLRLSGSYLSIVTLGFGEIVKTVLKNWKSVTNGTL